MFRGKESSNRIELSRLVEDLLNFCFFWAPCGSGEGAGGWGSIWGHGRVSHTHAHACTHTHVYMYRNCKWPPTWRHECLACLTCMCMCVCMCAWDIPPHTHTHPHPPICHPPGGGSPESLIIRKHFNLSRYFNSV